MDQISPFTAAEIHVWLTFYNEITDERLHSSYRQLLNAAEREQESRFYFPDDRRRYLITRALLRTVLSRYVSIHPKEWIFSTNAYGRPDIVNTQARDACWSFNISHTHNLIILGITRHRALGVDVENVGARAVSIDIAHHYFAPPEAAALNASPPGERQYRFFEYWTFKESYIKARGMGLSLPLDRFSFHFPNHRAVQFVIDPVLVDDAARWQFWQFRPRTEYLVALCAERVGSQPTRVVVRQTVPLVSETNFPFTFQRASA